MNYTRGQALHWPGGRTHLFWVDAICKAAVLGSQWIAKGDSV
jgi:hypothetical protein